MPQRLGVSLATAMVVTPLLGWRFAFAWIVAYALTQLVEQAVFRPMTVGGQSRMPAWRSALGCLVLFANTTLYGLPSIPLWLTGGPMGGLCAVIMLPAAVLYSMVNSPGSWRVLICTTAPEFIYLAMTPFFMVAFGASSGFAGTAGAAIAIFGVYGLVAWSRMTEAARQQTLAAREANRRRDEAEAAMLGRSAFLAAIGHDLRTPISAILAGAAEMDRTATDSAARAQSALITDAGMMMKAMLDDLLDHSKLDAGRMTVEVADFNLRALLAQTLRLWQGPIRAKGLSLRVEGAATIPASARGDAMRLRQVLNNLISNAVKFTAEGQVTLRLHAWPHDAGGHAVLIEVADTGPGMTPAQVARLFNPFDQTADGVSARYGGSGLGLTISRDLVQLMGGRLTARGRPGHGSCFTVSLVLEEATAPVETLAAPAPDPTPVAQSRASTVLSAAAPAQAAETPDADADAAEADETDERRLRVLVVDDHDINRRAVELILGPLDCDVSTAADGLAALALCDATAFDVVFMDVRMPELDGRETTRRLRAGGGVNADTPVIAVTADTAPDDIAACLAAGMTYFVAKPLTPGSLLGALSQVMSASAEDAADDAVAAA